jgi:hypothetical protein
LTALTASRNIHQIATGFDQVSQLIRSSARVTKRSLKRNDIVTRRNGISRRGRRPIGAPGCAAAAKFTAP